MQSPDTKENSKQAPVRDLGACSCSHSAPPLWSVCSSGSCG
jgi:hypothetical protein